MGDVSFSTEKPPRLAVSLFGALAESVHANPELFGADDASLVGVNQVPDGAHVRPFRVSPSGSCSTAMAASA